jgi:hypothetical protein
MATAAVSYDSSRSIVASPASIPIPAPKKPVYDPLVPLSVKESNSKYIAGIISRFEEEIWSKK